MPSKKRKFGDIGEKKAEDHLVKNGYKIIDKNFRIKNIGEIDIIAEKNNELFFIEVKTRSIKHETNFPIVFSINDKKRRNLKKICQLYLINKRVSPNKKWQVDAIFVKVDNMGGFKIEHMANILWESYY